MLDDDIAKFHEAMTFGTSEVIQCLISLDEGIQVCYTLGAIQTAEILNEVVRQIWINRN